MEDSEEPYLRSEMLWVRRDGSQCLGGDSEEDAKDQLFILVGDGRDLLWHGKDDVKIADFQKFGLPVLDPLRPSERLTFWAVPVPAAIEAIPFMTTLIATLEVAAERYGNSAGQGALYLARHAKEVQIVVRRDSLRDTMSQYLIDQIGKTPNIHVRTRTEIERVQGEGRVERVGFTSLGNGFCGMEEFDALFVFIGTRPCNDWLPTSVLRDSKGFVLTGRDLTTAEAYPRIWKQPREPLPLETSEPGVFAAGDLRAGAMNRVASAVGEGSMVVWLAHEYLALT